MKKILLTRYVWVFLGAVLLEQLIVASSTLWIGHLASAVSEGKSLYNWFGLFLISLTLPYAFTTLKVWALNHAKTLSFKNYIEEFTHRYRGKTRVSRNKDFRRRYEQFLGSESWLVIDEAFSFTAMLVAMTLNVLLNVIMFSSVLNVWFSASYLIVLPIVIFTTNVFSQKINVLSQNQQVARTGIFQVLTYTWETIFIGNRYNEQIWRTSFSDKAEKFRKGQVNAALSLEASASATFLLSLCPVILVNCYLVSMSETGMSLLAALVATLPRQVQTIQNIGDLVLSILNGSAIHTKLKGIQAALSQNTKDLSDGIVNDEKISVRNSRLLSVSELLETLSRDDKRRFTIRGANGSGKSTLLYRIKEEFDGKAFLLPAHDNLLFQCSLMKSESTGERMKSVFQELFQLDNISLLLIDEWDANLDDTNMMWIDEQIEELSEKLCVVEVRHRTVEQRSE